MGKSGISISKASEGMPRPSLLSAGAPTTDHNILDAMSSRGGPSGPVQKPRRLVWALIPLLAATAWGVSTQLQEPPLSPPVAQLATEVSAPTAPPAAVVAAPATQSLTDASTTAAVSSETTETNPFSALPATAGTAPASNSTPSIPEPAAFDMQAALSAPNASVQPNTPDKSEAEPAKTAAAPRPGPAKSDKASAPASAPPKTTATKTKAPARSKESPSDSTNRVASKPAPPTARKTAARDPDVELLSAIMKHLGEDNVASAGGTRSSQTIAELVKSCKRQDAIDALLCQRRICEGSWGKAQACPQNLAPKSATGHSTTAKAPG